RVCPICVEFLRVYRAQYLADLSWAPDCVDRGLSLHPNRGQVGNFHGWRNLAAKHLVLDHRVHGTFCRWRAFAVVGFQVAGYRLDCLLTEPAAGPIDAYSSYSASTHICVVLSSNIYVLFVIYV